MTVHAHPDDEASKGAATTARYVAEGHEVMVVTCTGGEAGSILNPAMDRPEVAANLAVIRRAEMARAAEILGVQHRWLGFVDSGLPEGDPKPPLPDGCFALQPLDVGTERLVRVVREFRPHVLITYDENGGYPHPDHIRCHEVSVAAYHAAGDPERFPDAGEPWQPLKLYYSAWARARMVAIHEKFLELGMESPFDEKWFSRPGLDERITTKIDVTAGDDIRKEALLAHATQIDPNSPFWFGLPPEVTSVYPWDDYILARSLVESPPIFPEDDLFTGIRERVQPELGR